MFFGCGLFSYCFLSLSVLQQPHRARLFSVFTSPTMTAFELSHQSASALGAPSSQALKPRLKGPLLSFQVSGPGTHLGGKLQAVDCPVVLPERLQSAMELMSLSPPDNKAGYTVERDCFQQAPFFCCAMFLCLLLPCSWCVGHGVITR